MRWFLSVLPLLVLLVSLMKLKLGSRTSGFLAWLCSLAVAWVAFGGHTEVLVNASLKGAALTFYVITIIWASTAMFRLVFETGKFGLVSDYMAHLTGDKLMLALLIAWCCSGLIQGVAGYGVPVAVCAPLMIAAGFPPLQAAGAVLVGHSWSVTFGSMGSSYHALALSTGISPGELGHVLGLSFILPIVVTGFCVAHLVSGKKAVVSAWPKLLFIGILMGGVQWGLAKGGLAQMASLLASLAGIGAIVLTERKAEDEPSPGSMGPDDKQTLIKVISPYAALLVIAVLGQVAKRCFAGYKFGFSFPGTVTSLGFEVGAARDYAAIDMFTHPAPLIVLATLLCLPILFGSGLLNRGSFKTALKGTVSQCLPTSLGILTMVMMALVMMDTGMTAEMAKGVAEVTGRWFPLFSPFVGALGCFMTGSNTNSNVLFGAFQMQTASLLAIKAGVAASAQTIGGSLGSAIAPAKVFLGASTAGLVGREAEILRKTIWYCLLTVLCVGIQALVVSFMGM